MRPYKATHPWISFKFDASKLTWLDQFRLGEAYSKCQHLAGVPLKPAVSSEMHLVYLVKGAMATTAIEGNTMTEDQVRDRVEGRSTLPPSREYQGVAVDNIVEICNEVLQGVAEGTPPDLSFDLVCEFNRRVLVGQELEPGVVPGRIRTDPVGVGPYRGAPAEDCEHLLRQLVDWLNTAWAPPDSPPELKFSLQVLKAILAHLYLAWIHPFGDGNGRTARLIEYVLLMRRGVPSPACHLLSNHYNLTRDRYYVQLQRSSERSRSGGVHDFVGYALEGLVDGLRSQIEHVRVQQMEVTWTNYVHEAFGRRPTTPTQKRRRELVLTMPRDESVRRRDIPELSPSLARAYAGRQQKTITRDLNALIEDGLIRRDRGGYRTNHHDIEAFLPISSLP